MITWPFLMHLKSDHLSSFRTEWGTFLQSSWKKWWRLTLCLGSQQKGKRMLFWVRFQLCMPKFPWSSAERRSSLIEQALGRRAVRVLPRPKRVTCDSINFRGTEPRQQLLIFNTKNKGNSEGEDALPPQVEAGGWYNFQAVPASSPMHYFFIFAWAAKRVVKLFFLQEEWFGVAELPRDNCTEWHFILWFIIQHWEPRGTGGYSSTWGNRDSLSPCFGEKACLCSIWLIGNLQSWHCSRAG